MYGRNIRTGVNIKKPDLTTTVINRHYGTTAKHCGSVLYVNSHLVMMSTLVIIDSTPKNGQMNASIHKLDLCRTRLTLMAHCGGDMLTRSLELPRTSPEIELIQLPPMSHMIFSICRFPVHLTP